MAVKKNAYLEKLSAAKHGYFVAGLQSGRQQILDMMSVVLNDPDVMGKDTFGKTRLLRVLKAIGECIDVYQKAWERDAETDYYRAMLDARLAEIYGEEMHDSFDKRYQYCSEFDYTKGTWK